MGKNVHLNIIMGTKDSYRLVDEVVNAVLKKGAVIDDSLPPWNHKDYQYIDGPIEHVKKVIAEEGGAISFIYSGLHFMVTYTQENSHIGVSCSRSNFRNEKQDALTGHFVDISRTIWNSITDEKIYGLADLDDYVDAFMKGEDLSNLREPTRYWINFYGQKLIKSIGLEKIAADEDYNLKTLKDGVMCITKKIPNQLI